MKFVIKGYEADNTTISLYVEGEGGERLFMKGDLSKEDALKKITEYLSPKKKKVKSK